MEPRLNNLTVFFHLILSKSSHSWGPSSPLLTFSLIRLTLLWTRSKSHSANCFSSKASGALWLIIISHTHTHTLGLDAISIFNNVTMHFQTLYNTGQYSCYWYSSFDVKMTTLFIIYPLPVSLSRLRLPHFYAHFYEVRLDQCPPVATSYKYKQISVLSTTFWHCHVLFCFFWRPY